MKFESCWLQTWLQINSLKSTFRDCIGILKAFALRKFLGAIFWVLCLSYFAVCSVYNDIRIKVNDGVHRSAFYSWHQVLLAFLIFFYCSSARFVYNNWSAGIECFNSFFRVRFMANLNNNHFMHMTWY